MSLKLYRDAAVLDAERRDLAGKYRNLALAEAVAFATRRRLDPESADECKAVALEALCRAALRWQRKGPFPPFARVVIGRALVRSLRRTRAANAPAFLPLAGLDREAPELVDRRTPSPAAVAEHRDEVAHWFRHLSPLEREAVRLSCLEERGDEAAAQELGILSYKVAAARRDAARRLRRVG